MSALASAPAWLCHEVWSLDSICRKTTPNTTTGWRQRLVQAISRHINGSDIVIKRLPTLPDGVLAPSKQQLYLDDPNAPEVAQAADYQYESGETSGRNRFLDPI